METIAANHKPERPGLSRNGSVRTSYPAKPSEMSSVMPSARSAFTSENNQNTMIIAFYIRTEFISHALTCQ